MAKQAIDNVTGELELPFVWDLREKFNEKIGRTLNKVDELYRLRCYEEKDLNDLIAKGINYAGTTYKDGKYLYLVYPAGADGKRVRQYVGSNEKDIKREIEKLERGQKVLEIKQKINRLEQRMSTILHYLDMGIKQ